MKKIFFLGFFICLTLVANIGNVRAQSSEYFTVSSFDSNVVVNKDGKVDVSEKIVVDFSEQRHGIYRTIPYKYPAGLGTTLKVRYQVLSVKDETGKSYTYSVRKTGNNFQIKIGNPDTYVSGHVVYAINYQLERVINFFDDHDELYFNVTGTEWPTTIRGATTTIRLPDGISKDQIKVTAFAGGLGNADSSIVPCDDKDLENPFLNVISCLEYGVNGDSTVTAKTQNLDYEEGLTVVAGWPKGFIEKPTFIKQLGWFFADNAVYSLPLLLPFITFYFLFKRWHKYGRDPKASPVVVAQFSSPDGLTPIELGAMIDENVDTRDIVGEIIDLARRGYLNIVEVEKKGLFGKGTFKLVKKKDADEALKGFDKIILSGLFQDGEEVTKEDLQNSFYTKLPSIKDNVYQSLTESGYFVSNPDKARKGYISIGSTVLAISLFLLFGPGIMFWPFLLGVGLSGVLFLIFGKVMPKRTDKGVKTFENIRGFEEFMNKAEKYRQNFAEKSNIFTEFLGFAIAFNVVGKWAKSFEGIDQVKPDWYQSNTVFNAIYFSSVMNDFSSGMSTAIASTPRSASGGGSGFGGGGFSGGGFGGGGGGSW